MPIALSWSRISDWNQCPRKFHLKYNTKEFPKEDATKSVHLVKGDMMHKQLEKYVFAKINGEDTSQMEWSEAVKSAFPLVDKLKSAFGQIWPERQVAVTYDWKQTEWFGSDVAFRAIWDYSGINPDHAFIVDYKTGKVTDYDKGEPGQLHLSALMGHHIYTVNRVDIFYAFIEHKVIKPDPILQLGKEDFPHIQGFFKQVYDRVNQEKEWKPRANQFCNYCPATKAQCPHSRKA